MGKRELILIAVFAVVGMAVYQFTAPPPAPGERGFSLSRIVDNMRREVRGNRASAEATNRAVQAVPPEIAELRVTLSRGAITITGEERADIEGQVSAQSTGFDQAEAQRLAQETVLKFEQTGTTLLATVFFPEAGRQTARLALKVPARLRVRVENNTGDLQIGNVEAVELAQARGESTIRGIRGRVSGLHRGGELSIADAGSLRLTARATDIRLEQILGEAVLNTQAGELKGTGLVGPIEIDSTSSDITLDGFDKTTGMLRITASAGSIDVKGLRVESRIDLRNASLDVEVDRAAPITIYSDGDEPVTLTAPAGGFRLDAVARDARITTVPDGLFARWGLAAGAKEDEEEQRAAGEVNGGGALISVRTTRGDITIRARDGTS
jgi:hypothetical protein